MCYFWGRYYFNMPLTLYFLASLSIGVAFVLFVVTLIYQPLSLIPYFNKKRRGFFKNIINAGSGIFAGGYLSWGIIEGGLKPKVEVIELPLLKLPAPFSAVQISDLHIGGLIEKNAVREIVQQTNTLKPDVIFLTGDIIDAEISRVSEALQELSNLQAPLGIYFVPGNHEYFHNIGELLGAIRSMGIKILENENILLEKNGENLINLAGVYDLFGRRVGVLEPNLEDALKDREESLPTILLAHQPKFILEIEEKNQVDLVLSGHTHGGQIFPFAFLVTLDQPYLAGLYQHNTRTQIYVNRGTGFWGPPMRILARAEITYFKFLTA
ncbi:metallophosphoesterase [Helicobacter mesocricetorum]|uniref:metallophosphoesterase n=1 Tax=Helicobacter mesocricetorum TaxID=87012 RepID=UPI001F294C0D|nr:metallophosphoesterase [Helicobacter mesocricetorum]